MALAEELLDNISEEQAAKYTLPELEPHLVIDEDRNIILPERYKNIASQGDHNMTTYTFDCPRFSDGRDMSKMMVYINYIRSDGEVGSYPADNVLIDDNNTELIHFDWTLLSPATSKEGVLAFLVCVCRTGNDGKIENHWSSRICREARITEGMDCHRDTIVDLYPDIITRILERLNVLEGGGTTSVQYTVQDLEEEQKKQARQNIDAASEEEMASKWILISDGETETKINGDNYEVLTVFKVVIPTEGGRMTTASNTELGIMAYEWPKIFGGGIREEFKRIDKGTTATFTANILVYRLIDHGYDYLEKDLNKLSEEKADKNYVISVFEELKQLIQNGNIDGAVAVLDQAILDLSTLA